MRCALPPPLAPGDLGTVAVLDTHGRCLQVILGKKMSEWCRFSVVWWHTFRWGGNDPFGVATLNR